MKVILLEDVKKQGKKNDIIEVSDGYAQNFLIKNNLAVKYTEISKKNLEDKLTLKEAEMKEEINKQLKLKKEIEKQNLVFSVKTGKEGKLFGSITTKQIAEELDKKGIKIDKKKIKTISPIDTLGVHNVEIELHKKVKFEIKINVKEA